MRVRDANHEFGGRSRGCAVLLRFGGLCSPKGLNCESQNIETGENDDVLHGLQNGIGCADNDGPEISGVRIERGGPNNVPIAKYKAAEKNAGAKIRQQICIMK